MTNFPFSLQDIYLINDYQTEIINYLGQFADVHYFKVKITQQNNENSAQLGLLRIGNKEGGLQRELQLREILNKYPMIVPLLTDKTITSFDEIKIDISENQDKSEDSSTDSENVEMTNNTDIQSTDKIDIPENNNVETLDTENQDVEMTNNTESQETSSKKEATELEEEYYESEAIAPLNQGEKLILLSQFPEHNLAQWLGENHSLEEILLVSSQLCQCFKYIYQRQWCVISIIPQFINFNSTIQILDLTGIYSLEKPPINVWCSEYSAPELHTELILSETMSSYIIGLIIYQAIHQKLPPKNHNLDDNTENYQLEIKPIPKLYQIMNIALSNDPQERFSLDQLLQLLIKTRQIIIQPQINWEIKARTTVGLSLHRLHNEDNYGIIYPISTSQSPLILAGIADGMGGLALGEVASDLAIKALLTANICVDLSKAEKRSLFLKNIVEKANTDIIENVKNGGTTFSVILGVGKELHIAHVGDSRIYLIRNQEIKQLTEDHSMVNLLLNSNQITEEESMTHPDRNILTKSLGSSRKLNSGYIQELSLSLEDEDILLMCSDGVWDLVLPEDFLNIFQSENTLEDSVNKTLEVVINKGANDNATLLALKCHISSNNYL